LFSKFSQRPPAMVFVLASAVLFAFQQPMSAIEFHVNPVSGKDSGEGTAEAPWRTLSGAQSNLRKITRSGMKEDITVILEDGVYFLESTWSFAPEDSGKIGHFITYRAKRPGNVLVTGGVPVSGWTHWKGDIYRAKLERSGKLRQLWVNGARATMARTGKPIPARGSVGVVEIDTKAEWCEDPATWQWTTLKPFDGIRFKPEDLDGLRDFEDIELFQKEVWSAHTVCVRARDGDALLLQQPMGAIAATLFAYQNLQPKADENSGKGYFEIRNSLNLLDRPGEFYFDRKNKTLYYYRHKNENMSKEVAWEPKVEGLVRIRGGSRKNRVKNLRFEGLTFSFDHFPLMRVGKSRGLVGCQSVCESVKYRGDGDAHFDDHSSCDLQPGSLELRNCENIVFKDNRFHHLAAIGISLYNDAVNCVIDGNSFYDIGSAAVNIGHPQNSGYKHPGIPADKEGPCDNATVTNNMIRNCTVENIQAPAISVFYVANLNLSHNDICRTNYSGVSVGWDWHEGIHKYGYQKRPSQTGWSDRMHDNKIEHNRVIDVMRELSDGGPIYVLGKQQGKDGKKGNRASLRSNFVGIRHHAGGGYYLDQGSAYWNIDGNFGSGGYKFLINGNDNGVCHDITLTNNFGDWEDKPFNYPAARIKETNTKNIEGAFSQFGYIAYWLFKGDPGAEIEKVFEDSGLDAKHRGLLQANLALSGVATASSTPVPASRAIDGNVNGYGGEHYFRSLSEDKPWWEVDLGEIKNIGSLELWNRIDANDDQLADFWVFISEKPFACDDPEEIEGTEGVWSYFYQGKLRDNPSGSRLHDWIDADTRGRHVRVQLNKHGELDLAEIVVWEQPRELRLNGRAPAKQTEGETK